MISIIIRTNNEERWIGHCLKSIFNQSIKDFEVILVDNQSTDGTVEKAKKYPIKLVSIDQYLPGKALNIGINNSCGDILVFISGHCIPEKNDWLEKITSDLSKEDVAGVYGRQIPMSFSSPQTKRDLLITFGLDKKIQKKDSFFHNANSAIKRILWEKVNFDPKITNIEDRVWAKEMINLKYKLVYSPEATVFHHHGIHHDNDLKRVESTVNVINKHVDIEQGHFKKDDLSILCIIPFRKKDYHGIDSPLIIKNTIDYAKSFDFIDKVVLLTDDKNLRNNDMVNLGIEIPFIRDNKDSSSLVDLKAVYKKYYPKIESNMEVHFDLVISLEPSYLIRPTNLLEQMLELLINRGFDSVIPVVKNYNWTWVKNNNGFKRIDKDLPRKIMDPMISALKGLACVSYSEYIRSGDFIGNNVGMVEVDKSFDQYEIKDLVSFKNVFKRYLYINEILNKSTK